jgi:hypothetical protein
VSGSPFTVSVSGTDARRTRLARGGPRGGVIEWIGTAGGHALFRNPAAAGRVYVDASSLHDGRASDPAGCFRTGIGANAYTEDEANAWWFVDLGEGRALRPEGYALRNVSECYAHALRSWRLEASADSVHWTTLRTHTDDDSIETRPHASAHWTLNARALDSARDEGEGGADPDGYRYFCLTQTGVNAFGRHFMMVGSLELYGLLTETPEAVAELEAGLEARTEPPARGGRGAKKEKTPSKPKWRVA